MPNSKNKVNKNKAEQKQRNKQHTKNIKNKLKQETATGLIDGVFVYTGPLSIADFAQQIGKPVTEIVKYFFKQGMMINQNTLLDEEQIGELALEFGFDFKKENVVTLENIFEALETDDDVAKLVTVPPVVTIMGHVDHGKTTLLDALRNSNVSENEAGGITQAIGAYQITTPNHKKVTFIDTPGHEAFSEMRSRGANATHIVVLIVAADDGVMPQTEEAIDHAKQAGVPIIVFINKIDKPAADPNKVKAELMNYGIVAEEYGGDIPFIEGAAKAKIGLNELLDTISVVAEIQDIKANPDKFASGVVLEAELDKTKGPVASVLIQGGTLKVRDIVVAGSTYGTIKDLRDDKNNKIEFALPSQPVVIYGLNDVPLPGDKFIVVNDEKMARNIAQAQREKVANQNLFGSKAITLDSIKKHLDDGELKAINVLIKADSQGSVEALKSSLNKLDIDGIKINIIRAAVGSITASEVTLAETANALIYGFNVRPSAEIRKVAEEKHVEIRLYDVIYKLIEDLDAAAKGLLDPELVEKIEGQAEVRQLFRHSAIGTIAGCYVTDGIIKRNMKIRVIRNGISIYNGEIAGLKHGKEDIKEAKQGSECGITIKNYNDIKEGDIIESYSINEVKAY
jgi:translation initiation factor IF-2